MNIFKITTPWHHNYAALLPKSENYRFEINNGCNAADYWFIWGGLQHAETVNCPAENIIYITDEAHELRFYNQDFLNQFNTIASVRTDLKHPNNVFIHEPQLWYFDKSRKELENMVLPEKLHNISVVASNLTLLEGHKKRFAFVNQLIGHFKDKLHAFGRGFNPVSDKWEAIAPYKYSVAIENNVIPNYFSEKLCECFLSYTMPIYYGCPNIKDYFDERALIAIDMNNLKASIEIIERAIDENLYERNFEYMLQARELCLNNYHFTSQITNLAAKIGNANGVKQPVTVLPELYFIEQQKQKELFDQLSSQGIKLPLKILKQAILNRLK